jgi:V8-like Glu-specific endopeptidase
MQLREIRQAPRFTARLGLLASVWIGLVVAPPSWGNHQQIQQGNYTPMARNYDSGSTMTLRSHAVGYAFGNSGCTGTWIGPTLFMTAAHCNLDPGSTARMEIYPTKQLQGSNSKRFDYNCTRNVAFAWLASNADLTVWQCGANANPKPGNRFGWVDYSLLKHDRVGDTVYSVFGHPVQNPSNNWGWVKLLTKGQVESKTEKSWAAPNCQANPTTSALPYVHQTSTYESSGSLALSIETHTAVIGPTSTGVAGVAKRNSSSMRQILNAGDLPPNEQYRIEATDPSKRPANDPLTQLHGGGGSRAKTSGGCAQNPGALVNDQATDSNGNHVLDIQEKLSDEIGQRPVYTLDFNTGWRRVLWETGSGFRGWQHASTASSDSITKEPWQFHARLTPSEEEGAALRHPSLNLKPDTDYALRVAYRAVDSRSLPRIRAAFEGGGQQCRDVEVTELKRPASPAPASLTSELDWTTLKLSTGPCTDTALTLSAEGQGVTDLRSLVLVEEDEATWAFDTWDQREPWRSDLAAGAGTYPRKSAHGFIYEVPPPESGIYSGILGADSMGEGLTLPTIPLRQCTRYDLAFKARALDNSTALRAIVKSAQQGFGGSLLWKQVQASGSWNAHSFRFETGDYDDAFLRFEGLRDSDNRVAVDAVRAIPTQDQPRFEMDGGCLAWADLPGRDEIERLGNKLGQARASLDRIGVSSTDLEKLRKALDEGADDVAQLKEADGKETIRTLVGALHAHVRSAAEHMDALMACCREQAPQAFDSLQQEVDAIQALDAELPDGDTTTPSQDASQDNDGSDNASEAFSGCTLAPNNGSGSGSALLLLALGAAAGLRLRRGL